MTSPIHTGGVKPKRVEGEKEVQGKRPWQLRAAVKGDSVQQVLVDFGLYVLHGDEHVR